MSEPARQAGTALILAFMTSSAAFASRIINVEQGEWRSQVGLFVEDELERVSVSSHGLTLSVHYHFDQRVTYRGDLVLPNTIRRNRGQESIAGHRANEHAEVPMRLVFSIGDWDFSQADITLRRSSWPLSTGEENYDVRYRIPEHVAEMVFTQLAQPSNVTMSYLLPNPGASQLLKRFEIVLRSTDMLVAMDEADRQYRDCAQGWDGDMDW